MKRSARVMPVVCCVLLLALILLAGAANVGLSKETARARAGAARFSSSMSARGKKAAELKEYNYYYDGTKWVEAWFQCELNKHLAIFTSNSALRYFPKSQPSQISSLSIKQTEEPDCGMMKCYYTFSAEGGGKAVVMESHYKDDESFWTGQYRVSLTQGGQTLAEEEECRWFERTRLAVVTDRRSIYVTEGKASQLEYRSFNFEQSSGNPSVDVKRGVRAFDKTRGVETFTFTKGEYVYVLNVSTIEKKPSVEVLVKKNGAVVQKERCLSYTYLKKV
jgi:hypothetical protein